MSDKKAPAKCASGHAEFSSERTSVLAFLGKGIPQRDQDCEAGVEFIKSRVCVKEHTGKLAE